MSGPKLTCFDFDGGRGECARLAFAIGGVPFIDDRVPFTAWKDRKADTPFGALPVLQVDGRTVAQSNGINRYVASWSVSISCGFGISSPERSIMSLRTWWIVSRRDCPNIANGFAAFQR